MAVAAIRQRPKRLSRARARAIAGRMRRIQGRLARGMARDMGRFLRDQAERAIGIYLDAQPKIAVPVDPGIMIPVTDDMLIMDATRPWVLQCIIAESGLAAEIVGIEGLVAADARTVSLLRQSAQRVTRINDTTRQILRIVLANGERRGLSPFQIARGTEEFLGIAEVIGPPWRADMIARTELAVASQQSAHDRYREAGVYEVEIDDGLDCGWTSHDDPDKADGSIRTLEEADEYPVAHPNCVRCSIPNV